MLDKSRGTIICANSDSFMYSTFYFPTSLTPGQHWEIVLVSTLEKDMGICLLHVGTSQFSIAVVFSELRN